MPDIKHRIICGNDEKAYRAELTFNDQDYAAVNAAIAKSDKEGLQDEERVKALIDTNLISTVTRYDRNDEPVNGANGEPSFAYYQRSADDGSSYISLSSHAGATSREQTLKIFNLRGHIVSVMRYESGNLVHKMSADELAALNGEKQPEAKPAAKKPRAAPGR